MASTSMVQRIERADGLDRVADRVQPSVRRVLDRSETLRNALHGRWLGHPLHAALIDIPLGAWTAGVVLDTMELARGTRRRRWDLWHRNGRGRADAVHAIGLVGALAAAVTGLADWSQTDDRPRRVGVVHGLANVAVAGLFGASLVARSRNRRGVGIALSTLGYGLVMFSSWLGGELAYRHGIGVNRSAMLPPGPTQWTTVADTLAVPEDGMIRVEAAGVPVLVTQRRGQVRAIGDTCSHLGCSLSEGRLQGDEVTCACHGSRFRVTDGAVTAGPATNPVARFETRIVGGRIELRAPREA